MRGFAALHPPDDFEFTIRSDIPLSGGLGTSAAAYVAGLWPPTRSSTLGADLLAEATRLEGHPDNVAAALLGGFVICADGHAERFEPPAGLEAVLVVPAQAVRTAKARAALPAEVPMADAVFNVGHASLLVLGLARGDLDLVARGLADRLHQPRRASLYPRVDGAGRAGRGSSARSARRSPAPGRPCSSGRGLRTRPRWRRAAARREAAGWAEVLRVPFAARRRRGRLGRANGGAAGQVATTGRRLGAPALLEAGRDRHAAARTSWTRARCGAPARQDTLADARAPIPLRAVSRS